MLMYGTKYQQYSSFVLGFGVFKLLITLNSSNWLRVHLVPNSISMVHHTLADVCDLLLSMLDSCPQYIEETLEDALCTCCDQYYRVNDL
jgi:hypothetical protein